MSGGAFDYKQYWIAYIGDEIEQLIINNDSKELDDWSMPKGRGFSQKTIDELKIGLSLMRKAAVYAQRIDWLVSGDDGEESFHVRLKKELEKL